VELRVTTTTSASPETVWTVMTDIEGSAAVLSGVERIERLDDRDGFGPGFRWRETRRIGGREASEELEVTAVDTGRSYAVEAESRGVRYHSVASVERDGAGSTLTMTFGAEPQGRLSKLMARTVGKAFESAARKALQQDLDDIVVAAETREVGV
jgi:carbon monoxide dehydrogenase subunit G